MATQSLNLLHSFDPSNGPSDGITIRVAIMTQLSESFSSSGESYMKISVVKTIGLNRH